MRRAIRAFARGARAIDDAALGVGVGDGDGARDVARDARGIGTSMGRARAIAGARDVGAGAAGERADRTGV